MVGKTLKMTRGDNCDRGKSQTMSRFLVQIIFGFALLSLFLSCNSAGKQDTDEQSSPSGLGGHAGVNPQLCADLFGYASTATANYVGELPDDPKLLFHKAVENFRQSKLVKNLEINTDGLETSDDCQSIVGLVQRAGESAKAKKFFNKLINKFDPAAFVSQTILDTYVHSFDSYGRLESDYTWVVSSDYFSFGIVFLQRPEYFHPDKTKIRNPPYLYVEDSPEYIKADLPRGTRVYSINGKKVKNFSFLEALEELRSQDQTALQVAYPGSYDQLIELDPIRFHDRGKGQEGAKGIYFRVDPENQIGYISIPTFDTPFLKEHVLKAWVEMQLAYQLEGLRGTIIDLRSNGGGLLSSAADLLGMILPNGKLSGLFGSRSGSSFQVKERVIQDATPLALGKIVVLVNYETASASEIFAAALQDYQAALIVGEPTFGKGVGQAMISLEAASLLGDLYITQFYTFSPLGKTYYLTGLKPDIEINEPIHEALNIYQRIGNVENRLPPKSYVASPGLSLDRSGIQNPVTTQMSQTLKDYISSPSSLPDSCLPCRNPNECVQLEEGSCILGAGKKILLEWIRTEPSNDSPGPEAQPQLPISPEN